MTIQFLALIYFGMNLPTTIVCITWGHRNYETFAEKISAMIFLMLFGGIATIFAARRIIMSVNKLNKGN